MADLATSSAATMSTINAGAESPRDDPKIKPVKPDEQLFKEKLAQAEKDHSQAQEKLNAVKAKIDAAQPRNRDSPASKRQQELKAELAAIRQQQSGFKASRTGIQEKVAGLDARLKSMLSEQKAKRSQVPYKNTDEIDRELQRLEKVAESSSATLVDQKKAIAEMSSLRKQKKAFVGFDEAQKGIDKVKADISDLKKQIDNPEAKLLSQKYDQADKELKMIKAEQDEAYKGINALRDERSKAQTVQQEKWVAIKDIKDQFYKARTAYREHEQEQFRLRKERQRAEQEAFNKEKRRKVADKKLEEASEPAYMDEIMTAEGLIRYFDPSLSEASKSLRGPSGFAAEALRTVDGQTAIQGMKVAKKEDREENYFMGNGGKKSKKTKKGAANSSPAPGTPTEGKFNLSIGIIEELAKVNIEPPMSQTDVPTVIEKLKAKREQWKKDQDQKTKDNVEKAKKEIERLESEAKSPPSSSSSSTRRTQDIAKKPAAVNQRVNGTVSGEAELAQEKDAVDDVAEELREAAIEDKTEV